MENSPLSRINSSRTDWKKRLLEKHFFFCFFTWTLLKFVFIFMTAKCAAVCHKLVIISLEFTNVVFETAMSLNCLTRFVFQLKWTTCRKAPKTFRRTISDFSQWKIPFISHESYEISPLNDVREYWMFELENKVRCQNATVDYFWWIFLQVDLLIWNDYHIITLLYLSIRTKNLTQK